MKRAHEPASKTTDSTPLRRSSRVTTKPTPPSSAKTPGRSRSPSPVAKKAPTPVKASSTAKTPPKSKGASGAKKATPPAQKRASKSKSRSQSLNSSQEASEDSVEQPKSSMITIEVVIRSLPAIENLDFLRGLAQSDLAYFPDGGPKTPVLMKKAVREIEMSSATARNKGILAANLVMEYLRAKESAALANELGDFYFYSQVDLKHARIEQNEADKVGGGGGAPAEAASAPAMAKPTAQAAGAAPEPEPSAAATRMAILILAKFNSIVEQHTGAVARNFNFSSWFNDDLNEDARTALAEELSEFDFTAYGIANDAKNKRGLVDLMRFVEAHFKQFPNVVSVEGSAHVVGDEHSSTAAETHAMAFTGVLDAVYYPESEDAAFRAAVTAGTCLLTATAIFNGDYVDRAPKERPQRGLDVLLVLASAVLATRRSPRKLLLLRGNHECEEVTGRYGFTSGVLASGIAAGSALFAAIYCMMSALPLVCILDKKIMVVHACTPVNYTANYFAELNAVDRTQFATIPITGADGALIGQLLWPDYTDADLGVKDRVVSGRLGNPAGVPIYDVSQNQLTRFLQTFKLTAVIRSHQCVKEGAHVVFPNCITVFSVPNYSGMDNEAAVVFYDSTQPFRSVNDLEVTRFTHPDF